MTNVRVAGILIFLACTPTLMAQLSGKDRDLAKQMISGDLYLRNNVPCRYTSGGFGIGAVVVTEVSPTVVDWDRNLKAIEDEKQQKRKRGIDTIYWGFGPNDVIRYGKLYFKGDTLELWAEGAKPKDTEIWIRFVAIKNMDDFKKAFDLIVSKKPLQDEHPEWPEEIRKAVAARQVVEGMTKDQAFSVVGTPVGTDKREVGGTTEETWILRQETGASGGWGKVISSTTGFPASLRFIDGKVTAIGQVTKPLK